MALSIFLRKVVYLSNNENSEAIKILAQEMKKVAQTIVDEAKFDKTIKAKVTAKLGGKENNKYLVLINGQEMECTSYNTLSVGDICYVTVVQNDYSNLFISSPASKSNMASSWELETKKLTF